MLFFQPDGGSAGGPSRLARNPDKRKAGAWGEYLPMRIADLYALARTCLCQPYSSLEGTCRQLHPWIGCSTLTSGISREVYTVNSVG